MNPITLKYSITIFVIIALSYFYYSFSYYPLLNSDDALSVLMAHYYQFPKDLYCWGQDRGGTLIPMLSQFFIQVFGISALTAVSLSSYLILIIGFLSLSSLIQSNYYKLIFAIFWFFPFQRFIDLLRFPIGVEYSLLGLAIFLFYKLERIDPLQKFSKHTLVVAIIVILTLAVWVSDLAMVSILVLMGILFLFHCIKKHSIVVNRITWVYSFIGIIICFTFITYAKSFAIIKTKNYLSINGLNEIEQSLQIIRDAFWTCLTFNSKETIVNSYIYLVIFFIIYFSYFIFNKKAIKELASNKWISFFAADTVAIFITFLLSSWVLANGMGRWYFVASYISLSLTIILSLDLLEKRFNLKYLRIGILLIALVGALSPIYTMKYVRPKTLRPMAEVVGELKQLGEIGLIAEYWNSYINSCPDPELIVVSPHDQLGSRNQAIVDKLFTRKNIYVIKDMWLEEFPDTLYQYGHTLVKVGDQFKLAGSDLCKYEKVK
ncbi:MAG: hypothetical protein IPJ43_21340 [Saprospiraceae bacterium]|nr:hypothetical protein [Saprospiraceae bacterium]